MSSRHEDKAQHKLTCPRSRQESHTLCVYGYVRECCSLYKILIPDELIQICFVLYFIKSDCWNALLGNARDFEFKNENRIAKQVGNNGWTNLYGSIIVRKGDIQIWKLMRCCDDDLIHNHGVLGIMASTHSKTISNAYFTKATKEAHAISMLTGTLQGSEYNKKSSWRHDGSSIYKGDTITMTLDMTKENVTLSYKINEKDLGVAFNNIDIDKEYCLALSVYWTGDAYEIIE